MAAALSVMTFDGGFFLTVLIVGFEENIGSVPWRNTKGAREFGVGVRRSRRAGCILLMGRRLESSSSLREGCIGRW